MKKRSLSISILVLVSTLSLILIANSAWAGSTQRHRWEGVAIGIGAAILGSALYQHHKSNSHIKAAPCREPVYCPPSYDHRHMESRGHWEWSKEWVPPTYREVWNPGHYDHCGEWIEGRWIRIVDEPGYWTEKRVWVAGKHGRHWR